MTASAPHQHDRLAAVSNALRASLSVPTDTFITEDIPLLLTRLSQIPPVSAKDTTSPPQIRN
ncbi:hypothetical protein [Sphingomonas sp. CLY1604]|uniref:hypothetical protein n=1 Tax=Sphingomonas sp. CLY1604 TaxID=3457786 RepID=UPI003FD82130